MGRREAGAGAAPPVKTSGQSRAAEMYVSGARGGSCPVDVVCMGDLSVVGRGEHSLTGKEFFTSCLPILEKELADVELFCVSWPEDYPHKQFLGIVWQTAYVAATGAARQLMAVGIHWSFCSHRFAYLQSK